jgi:GxxExxY protein
MSRDPRAMERADLLSNEVIGAAIELHRCLGPGLLESAYEACLCHELRLRGLPFERQVPLPVVYKGLEIDAAYRLDVKVEGLVVLELKAVEKLEPIHQAQLTTYLRLADLWLGLLLNFNVVVLKNGIKRIVNG